MKTRIVKWDRNNPSIEENNGHDQSEWGLQSKKETNKKNSFNFKLKVIKQNYYRKS